MYRPKQCRSYLAVACLTEPNRHDPVCCPEALRSNRTVLICVFMMTATMIYGLGPGLQSLRLLQRLWVDSAFYTPWDSKMPIGFRAE